MRWYVCSLLCGRFWGAETDTPTFARSLYVTGICKSRLPRAGDGAGLKTGAPTWCRRRESNGHTRSLIYRIVRWEGIESDPTLNPTDGPEVADQGVSGRHWTQHPGHSLPVRKPHNQEGIGLRGCHAGLSALRS